MADYVGQGNNRGRGAPRRPRGHAYRGRRDGWGQPWDRDHQQRGDSFLGRRKRQLEDDVEAYNVQRTAAPPRELLRRGVHIGVAALDRMLQMEPEELILQITNRVSTSLNNVTDNDNSRVLAYQFNNLRLSDVWIYRNIDISFSISIYRIASYSRKR